MSDPFQDAVAVAKTEYPRLANYPIALSLSKTNTSGNSETFEPQDPLNPIGGHWNIEIRGKPYADKPEAWPDLIGLEGLHALQAHDPAYQTMTEWLVHSLTPEQVLQAQQRHQRDSAKFNENQPFDQYLRRVHIQEFVRGGIFGDFFKKYEKGYDPNEWQYTPEQRNMLSLINSYLRTAQ